MWPFKINGKSDGDIGKSDGNWSKLTNDRLINDASGQGLKNDKVTHGFFGRLYISFSELENMYRFSWLSAAAIDYPIEDMLKPWREWTAKYNKGMLLAEKTFQYKQKIKELVTTADLYGGAVAIVFIRGQENFESPLDLSKIGIGDLVKIIILDRYMVNKLEMNYDDPLSENYLKPTFYQVLSSNPQTFHYSRVIEVDGKPLPLRERRINMGWGDSRLYALYDSIQAYESVMGATNQLVNEANIDVISGVGLGDALTTEDDDEIEKRASLISRTKSTFKSLFIDKSEDYERHGVTFSGLSNVLEIAQEDCSGGLSIPVTRLFGKAKAGMSGDTNDGDIRNYHEKLENRQDKLKFEIALLDEVIVRNTLGTLPDDIDYVWNDLSIMTGSELAKMDRENAEADKIRIESGVIAPEEARHDLPVRYELDDAAYKSNQEKKKSELDETIKGGKNEKTNE